ncbi:MAG: guanylate kinase [Anaerolineaceae bacterium]|nr:guanylate kinase [Anaerolineaceae bacterium]
MAEESLSFDIVHPTPLLVVISGPSGVGKDAVLKAMQKRGFSLHYVVTMTSRPPRDGEVEGVDYFFVSREKFEELIGKDEFIEHAVVYEDYKGIPKTQIREALVSQQDVILRVDVQGAMTLRSLCPDAILIFLIPSNEKEWYDRLRNRKTETVESLALRLNTARQELEYLSEFDYVVINAQDHLEETVDSIAAILQAEHHRVIPRKVTL